MCTSLAHLFRRYRINNLTEWETSVPQYLFTLHICQLFLPMMLMNGQNGSTNGRWTRSALVVGALITPLVPLFANVWLNQLAHRNPEPRTVLSEYLYRNPLCLRDGVFTEQVKPSNRCDAGLNRWCENAKRSGGLVPVLLLQHIDWGFFWRRKTESLTTIPLHGSRIKSL